MEIVSNNNSAVENVKEKLESTGLDFLCAQLGRASNKKEFVDRQTGSFPDMESWKLDNAKKVRLEAVSLSRDLQELYECQEKLSLCSERLTEYKRQVEMFPKKTVTKRQWPVGTLEKYFILCNREMERKHHLSWWTRFRFAITGSLPPKMLRMSFNTCLSPLESENWSIGAHCFVS